MTDRGLILFSDGRVDEIDGEGNQTGFTVPGLYDELIEAGDPLFADSEAQLECIDISVSASGEVIAYTTGGGGVGEHPMGAATPQLSAWLESTKEG